MLEVFDEQINDDDDEIRVRGPSRSLEISPFDGAHRTSY